MREEADRTLGAPIELDEAPEISAAVEIDGWGRGHERSGEWVSRIGEGRHLPIPVIGRNERTHVVETTLARLVHVAVDRRTRARLGDELYLDLATLAKGIIDGGRARLPAVGQVGSDEVSHDNKGACPHYPHPVLDALVQIGHHKGSLENRMPQKPGRTHHGSIVASPPRYVPAFPMQGTNSLSIRLSTSFGVWRSLVARFVRDEEAVGSNPATPTTGRGPMNTSAPDPGEQRQGLRGEHRSTTCTE